MLNLLFQYYNCEIIIFRIQRLYTITHVPLLVHGNENIKFRFPNRCWLDSIFVSQLWNYYFQNSELVLLGFHFWIVVTFFSSLLLVTGVFVLHYLLSCCAWHSHLLAASTPPLKIEFSNTFYMYVYYGFSFPLFLLTSMQSGPKWKWHKII